MPVLFYLLCLTATATATTYPSLVLGAWLFVLLRCVHSAIHCTYNKVNHRFAAYASSTLLLYLLWGTFAITLLQA